MRIILSIPITKNLKTIMLIPQEFKDILHKQKAPFEKQMRKPKKHSSNYIIQEKKMS